MFDTMACRYSPKRCCRLTRPTPSPLRQSILTFKFSCRLKPPPSEGLPPAVSILVLSTSLMHQAASRSTLHMSTAPDQTRLQSRGPNSRTFVLVHFPLFRQSLHSKLTWCAQTAKTCSWHFKSVKTEVASSPPLNTSTRENKQSNLPMPRPVQNCVAMRESGRRDIIRRDLQLLH